jgi:acyl-ACP thioesterase
MALVPEVCTAPYRAVIEYRRPIKYGEDVTIQWTRNGAGDRPDVQIALTVGADVRAAALLRKL